MKAKEWAKKFNDIFTLTETVTDATYSKVKEVIAEYAGETRDLIDARSKNSGEFERDKKKVDTRGPAVEGAIREQKQKWQSVCTQVPLLHLDMFDVDVMNANLQDVVAQQAAWKKKVAEEKEKAEKGK